MFAKIAGSDTYYYIRDALGSTRQVWKSGDTSPIFSVATYKPYGTPVTPTGAEKFEYAGEMIVSAAGASPGLYYIGARWMDPELGRWLSLDSEVGSPSWPQTMNRYVYCVNNPLRFTDPSGESLSLSSSPLIDETFGFGMSVSRWSDFGDGALEIFQWSYAGLGYGQLARRYTYTASSYLCSSSGVYTFGSLWLVAWVAELHLESWWIAACGGRVSIGIECYVYDETTGSMVSGSYRSLSLIDESRSSALVPYNKVWSPPDGVEARELLTDASLTQGHTYTFRSGIIINTMATGFGIGDPGPAFSSVYLVGRCIDYEVAEPAQSYQVTYGGGGGGGRFYYM